MYPKIEDLNPNDPLFGLNQLPPPANIKRLRWGPLKPCSPSSQKLTIVQLNLTIFIDIIWCNQTFKFEPLKPKPAANIKRSHFIPHDKSQSKILG